LTSGTENYADFYSLTVIMLFSYSVMMMMMMMVVVVVVVTGRDECEQCR